MIEEKINIAVIGVGLMGQNHARVLFNLENVNFKAVVDANKGLVEKIGKKYNLSFYTSYKEMFKKQKIDAVCIAVPTKFHKKAAIYAANLGKHVLLEKPIALNEKEAQEIIE